MVIGLTLTVIHLVGIPLTGTSVNPARSLGPALIVGGTALSQVWLFIVAPLVGGVVAAGIDLARSTASGSNDRRRTAAARSRGDPRSAQPRRPSPASPLACSGRC